MIFFVLSVKTVQISNANLKYKSQKQISNTNLKCKSQIQVQNANLKCNDQIRRIPGNVGKQEWMGGSEDVQYTIRLGTCLSFLPSLPRRLKSEMQDKIRGISGKQGQAVL